ncbi:MAG TPA: hypothetical protein PK765_05330 [bacterium]|nr:hypothetical protein [bacterium]
MKRFLLLLTSLFSLALALPLAAYAEDSTLSSSGSAVSTHEPTQDHTTGSAETPSRIPYDSDQTPQSIRAITSDPETLAVYDSLDTRMAKLQASYSGSLQDLLSLHDRLDTVNTRLSNYMYAHPADYPDWIPYARAKISVLQAWISRTIDSKYVTAGMLSFRVATEVPTFSPSWMRNRYPELDPLFDRSDAQFQATLKTKDPDELKKEAIRSLDTNGKLLVFLEWMGDAAWSRLQVFYEYALWKEYLESQGVDTKNLPEE